MNLLEYKTLTGYVHLLAATSIGLVSEGSRERMEGTRTFRWRHFVDSAKHFNSMIISSFIYVNWCPSQYQSIYLLDSSAHWEDRRPGRGGRLLGIWGRREWPLVGR